MWIIIHTNDFFTSVTKNQEEFSPGDNVWVIFIPFSHLSLSQCFLRPAGDYSLGVLKSVSLLMSQPSSVSPAGIQALGFKNKFLSGYNVTY